MSLIKVTRRLIGPATSSCILSDAVLSIGPRVQTALRLVSTTEASVSPEVGDEVSPQGVQGEDCVHYQLWQDNCARYGFTNCNEQLQGIQTGRKTLAQVLAEQDKLIADIAREFRAVRHVGGRQGVQDGYSDFPAVNAPCPQGVQGDDCARFKLWLENCHRFGVEDCIQQYSSFKAGRKTLAQIFEEQDRSIREAVKIVRQQRRSFSTFSGDSTKTRGEASEEAQPHKGQTESPVEDSPVASGAAELTQRQKLQRAVKEYGSTVVVFHVTISLASLGFFYLLVSSGLDVAGFLLQLNIGGELLKSKLAAGTGTFVIAYAVHKVFAPVRIATTLTATPFIVRYLRKVGFLKTPGRTQLKVKQS